MPASLLDYSRHTLCPSGGVDAHVSVNGRGPPRSGGRDRAAGPYRPEGHRVCRDVGSETIINLKSPIISIFVSCGLVFQKKSGRE